MIPVNVSEEIKRLGEEMKKSKNPGSPFKDFRSFINHFSKSPEMAEQVLKAVGCVNLLEFLQSPDGIKSLLEDST